MTKISKGKAVKVLDPQIVHRVCTKCEIDKGSKCWLWTGHTDRKGYGQFWYQGRAHWAHRIAYAAFVGPIEPGNQIDHTCGNPSCVNPACLEQVSPEENRKRQAQRAQHTAEGVPF